MPSHPRIKICGMTREEDLAVVATLPVAYIGFVFWPDSPRAVTPQRAAELGRRVPPDVLRVGVFVNASASEVARTVAEAGLQAVQLHGDEAIDEFLGLDVPLIKAVSLGTDDDVERVAEYPSVVRLLVDAPDEIRRGGTGRPADWDLAAKLATRREVLLAGGLSAANVADAIRRVRPWGVDVSSGVEDAPGRKNAARMAAFVRAVVEDSPEVA